jgi:ribosome-associated protein
MAKTERKRPGGASAAAARAVKTSRRISAARSSKAASLSPASESARAKDAETAPRKSRKLPSEVSRTVSAALDKKAQDVVVLDLRHTPAFTDFFVLCSGLNQRQVKAIADAVEETLRAAKVRPAHVEGYDRAEWVLMDFFSFIVHVFTPQTRAFYGLERLWGDAERINVSEGLPAGS